MCLFLRNIKRIYLIFFIVLFINGEISVLGQRNYFNCQTCEGVKYDTLNANLIIELNSEGKFYLELGVILQSNLIFLDHDFGATTTSKMYNSDTVIIKYWAAGHKIYLNKDSCLNLSALSNFIWKIDGRDLTRKEKKKYRKSVLIDKNGVKYLKIRAKLLVINAGKFDWIYPKIYCIDPSKETNNVFQKFCTKTFNNTLLIADILEFSFRNY